MLPEVFLISKPEIDFKTLLQLTLPMLGRSISQGLDSRNEKIGSLASFICMLDDFVSQNGISLNDSLIKAGSLIKNLHFSFLTIGSPDLLLELLEETGLDITSTETKRYDSRAIILSGNGLQWRDTILNLSSGRESGEVRLLMNKIFAIFSKMGLSLLWATHAKESLEDSTFRFLPTK